MMSRARRVFPFASQDRPKAAAGCLLCLLVTAARAATPNACTAEDTTLLCKLTRLLPLLYATAGVLAVILLVVVLLAVQTYRKNRAAVSRDLR